MIRNVFSRNRLLVLIAASSIVLSGCFEKAQEGAPSGMPAVKVVAITTEAKDVLIKAELPGRTKASKIAEVRPQVGGIILHQNFEEGSYVKEGETLYQIDPATYDAALKQAQARLAQAEATQFAAAEKAKRINAVSSSSNAVSKQDVDDANSLLIQANAQVAAAKAEVNTAEISLNYTKMLAPISGQIGRSNYTQGALVAAGQATEMAVIQQNDPMRVDITYAAKDFSHVLQQLKNGRLVSPSGAEEDTNFAVSLIMDDGSIYSEKGFVKFSDRTVDPTTGSILIQAEFPNNEQIILPGMFVRAIVEQGIQKGSIEIPQKAIFRDPKGLPFVIVVTKDNFAEVRPVVIEQSNGNNWLIAEGLKAGETVVVEGIQQIQGVMRRTDKVPLEVTIQEVHTKEG